ncbi:MAG: hypothetical protein V1810_02890 [Candidatus Beckwithbacteria bacterium]
MNGELPKTAQPEIPALEKIQTITGRNRLILTEEGIRVEEKLDDNEFDIECLFDEKNISLDLQEKDGKFYFSRPKMANQGYRLDHYFPLAEIKGRTLTQEGWEEIRPKEWLECNGRKYFLETAKSGLALNLVPEALVQPGEIIKGSVPGNHEILTNKQGLVIKHPDQFGENQIENGFAAINHPDMRGKEINISLKEIRRADKKGEVLRIGDLPFGIEVEYKDKWRSWFRLKPVKLEPVQPESAPAAGGSGDLFSKVIEPGHVFGSTMTSSFRRARSSPLEPPAAEPPAAEAGEAEADQPFDHLKVFNEYCDRQEAPVPKPAELTPAEPAEPQSAPEKKKKVNWNVPIKKVLAEVASTWKESKKLRSVREASTLVFAALADLNPAGGLAAAILNLSVSSVTGFVGLVDKSLKIGDLKLMDQDFWSEKDKATVKKLGFTEEEFTAAKSETALLFKSMWRDSFLGKALGKNPEIDLSTQERINSTLIGVTAAAGSLFIAELARSGIPIPVVRSLASRLLTRFIVQEFVPRTLIHFVGKWYMGKNESQKKSKDFVDLSLSAMSATFVTLTTGMMAYKGLMSIEKPPAEAPAQPTLTPEPTNTAAAAFTHTVTSQASATPPPPPEASATPEPTMTEIATATDLPIVGWELGQEINDDVLESAITAHHGWGLDTDNNGQHDIQLFYLDENQGPDYVIIGQDNLIHDGSGHYFLDANDNGIIDQGEKGASWNWSSLEAIDPRLQDLDTAEPGLNSDFTQVNQDNLLGFQPIKAQARPINPELRSASLPPGDNWDLNNDDKMDIITDEINGRFSDVDGDGKYTVNVDEKITSLQVIEVIGGNKIQEAEYENGSRWVRQEDGTMIGYLFDGRTLDTDSGGILSNLQRDLALENPAWSPQLVGRMAFLNQNLTAEQIQPPAAYTPPEGSLTLEQLAMGPEGGQVGILQETIHNANENLTATQIAASAYIASDNGHLTGEAMHQDINATLTRFSLENELARMMVEENGVKNDYAYAYARHAALDAMQNPEIVWNYPSDKIYTGKLNFELIQNVSNQTNTGWWDNWLEEWLKQHGYK